MSAHTVRHIEAQSFSLRRGADLGLVVLLLFFTALVPAGTAGAEEERWELPEERTVFAKVFDYGDGSQAVHVGLEPLHYGDPGSGELLEIDPTLTFEDGWSNETNSFPTFLPPLLGDGSALRLGPELAVTWRPGRLSARLINGLELELDDPALSWGQPSEERSNAVVYRDLYPGLDLLVAVRRGAVDLELVLRDWLLPVEPEQVAQLFVEAEVEIPAELLERVEERAQFGEPLEEIPLYLGRAGDEHVIAVMADPGLPAPHLEEHAAALVFDSQGQTAPAPAEWLSTLGEWLASGRIRYGVDFSRFSGHLEEEGGVGVADAALMAPFKLTSADRMDSQRYFAFPKQGRVAVTISRRETANGPRYPYRLNRIEAGLGDGRIHRAVMVFAGTGDLQQKMQQMGSWEIQEMSLGTLDVHYLPPNGVVDIEADTVVAGSVASQMLPDGGVPLRASDSILDAPYNQTTRPIPGGTLQTGTWDYLAGAGFSSRTIGGKVFSFGPLSNPAPASSTPRAALDLAGMLKKNWPNFYLGLALPQETTTCIPCTDAHPNPAVQALNGEYRVGAGFYDLRLEVRLRNTVSHTATVFATSVGGHNDQLYPGEALEWDLELTALSAGASGVELTTQSWDPLDGVSFTFHDPANPATALNSAQLSALGDTVRVRATWNRARPDLYGKTQDLLLDARLAPSGRLASGEVKIPIKLRAPEGQPSFSSIYPVFDDNVSVPMGLAWVQLPSQVRGAVLGEARLRHQSGPTASLQQGVHWDLWSSASPGNDGEVVIYPDQFRPGMYTV
ncbi:MAG: hypothetical protein SX243_24275, partial [Acidobacteriota bacterium]|nr:hypothetical protein [Acidobacteriota bacterium]